MVQKNLRPLREDIDIHLSPPHKSGQPGWILHDISANRFVAIGRKELLILKHWGLGTPDAIVAAVNKQFWPSISQEDVEAMSVFLAQHQFLEASSARDTEYLLTLSKFGKKSVLSAILHYYLSFRIPLLRPEHLLRLMLPFVAWISSPLFIMISIFAGACGLAMVSLRWDEFVAFIPDMLTAQGIVWTLLAMFFAKVLHEFGHAFTATRYGCRVGTMGIAVIVGYPMLYTDATEAWKLPSHRQRFLISFAGIGVELLLACWSLLFWNVVEPGKFQDILFLFAGVTWLITLAINASPFMRFDGYYLLMDAWGIPNLAPRAFALAKWKLRSVLFGINNPPPDHVSARDQRLMIIYAVTTWLYRFFLFLGIAYLVYSFFFKVLGIFLMTVEIGWFIILPVFREMHAWWKMRQVIDFRAWYKVCCGLLLLVVCILFFPFPETIRIPALVMLDKEAHIYAPLSGKIETITGEIGENIDPGQVVARLSNPELERAVSKARTHIAIVDHRISAASVDTKLSSELTLLQEELRAAISTLRERENERDRLTIHAGGGGRVMSRDRTLAAGSVVKQGHELMVIGTPGVWVVRGFVDNDGFSRLQPGLQARFFPDNLSAPALDCRVESIDSYADRSIQLPLLIDIHGGQLETISNVDAPIHRIMQNPRHRVTASLDTAYQNEVQLRGVLIVHRWSSPLSTHIWRKAKNILHKEMNF